MSQKQQNKFDITTFTFRQDHILIQALREVSINGLVNPEGYDDKPEFATVIKVGTDVQDIQVGDIVFFGKYSTEQTRNLGNDYFIIRQEDVKAVGPRNGR